MGSVSQDAVEASPKGRIAGSHGRWADGGAAVVEDLLAVSRFHNQQNPNSMLPGPYPLDKKFYWRTVTPISKEHATRR